MKLCYHCMQQIQNEKLHTCPNCGKSLKVEQTEARFLKPGTVLQGKFVVGYPIGYGGFGNTYIGWNSLLLRKVAIKEFYPEQYSGRGSDGVTVTVPDDKLKTRFRKGLQQFLEEARSVASLQDIRGVVAISNFFEEHGTGYIVMEYLEGMDVKTILKKSGDKKDYEWSRRVILTVLHTLRDIHKRGVLHRDIAPDNIFVTNEGIIKLIDFGAAKHASALANMKSDVVLKVGYAPIEQYSRNAPQGPYTDLYAVAALFYRMLTGQKPIPASERLDNDPLIPPSEMGIELPQQAEMAIMVCLNVQPQYRLQSADDFMEALDGKNFVPVYEPEWILPPVNEHTGIIGKVAQLPIAAKVALCVCGICLIGGLIAGSVAFFNNDSDQAIALETSERDEKNIMKDYRSGEWTYDEAVADLKSNGYETVAVPIYEFNSSVEEGIIVEQSVEAGERLDQETQIEFTVSGGEKYYTLPDFSSYSKKEIIEFFTQNNFDVDVYSVPKKGKKTTKKAGNPNEEVRPGKIEIKSAYSDDYAKGECYEQSSPAGEKIDSSENVIVYISLGKKSDYVKELPNFKGLTEADARKKLEEAGLFEKVELKFVQSSNYVTGISAGQVNAQSVEAGKKINILEDENQEVTLYIQKAKPQPKPKKTPKSSGSSSGGGSSKKKDDNSDSHEWGGMDYSAF
ncbi:MAG: PASTA domain-containing protein [Lachnospiraceae bacterium]